MRTRYRIRTARACAFAALLLVSGLPVAAQDAGGVSERSPRGGDAPTFEELRSRLSAGTLTDARRLELLEEAADRAPTVAVAVELIRAQQEALAGRFRAEAIAAEAELHALRGDLAGAAETYAAAAGAAADAEDTGGAAVYRLEEASLRLELGEAETAARLAERVIETARSADVQRRAALLVGRADAAAGRLEEAFRRVRALSEAEHAPTVQPETLLFLHRMSRRLDREAEAERAERLLSRLYPASPELMLVRGEAGVAELPRPSTLLGFEAAGAEEAQSTAATDGGPGTTESEPSGGEEPQGVQVGSFRSTENARDMQRQIGAAGFSAEIRDSADGGYHRVVIPVDGAPQAERLILRLKEQGFEGFLVFGE
jgi:tetratricopeptide (TPR) repeat protein